ncbi:MAG: TIGR03750 family conjugal transfer protein [Gammaproteobacteria bacterium]|jgi:conjugative transfer region protein (TIGR03750 family)|nr:TIGR03750 family conjugal transfer protein [Gammaproteobacteria bacterium]
MESSETLADRLNNEPVIFRGSTNSELGMILLVAVLFWVPMGMIIATLLGSIAMSLGIAAFGVLLTVFFGSTYFQYIKRGRPDNYYQHNMLLKLSHLGIRKSKIIHKDGAWSLGRD